MKNIRLLALDLDGTLLTKEKHLTEYTRRTLLAAIEAGIEPVFVTGRPLGGLPDEAMCIPGIRYVITSNGALTTDLSSGKDLRSVLLDNETVKQIIRLPEERELIYSVFIKGIGYSPKKVYERIVDLFIGTPHESYVRKSRRPAEDMTELLPEKNRNVENIWIRAADLPERDELHAQIKELGTLQTVLTADTDVEIGCPGADKGLAITELAAMLQIEKNNILAIGDNDNDLGMFRAAGTSVAMGNAPAAVKQQASFVTDSNQEEGAAKAIAELCRLGK